MPAFLSVQYLRALAALAVVWYHAHLELQKIIPVDLPEWFRGSAGVDLFFVISGFIIWVTTHRSSQGAASFWYRRLVRVVPLYWVFTLLMVGLLLALPGMFERPHLDIGHVIQSLLFIPHFDPFRPTQTYPLLQVGWTLNYEMFFYLLFGLCLWLRPSRRVAVVMLVLGLLVTIGAVLDLEGALISTYTDPILLEFMAGVMIGYAVTNRWCPHLGFGCSLILLSVFAYVGLNQGLAVNPVEWRVLCWGVPAVLLVAGAVTVERARWMPKIAWLHLLGNASFALYLSHPFTLGAMRWGFDRLPPAVDLPSWSLIPAAMIGSVLVGLMVHLAMERPLIRLLRRQPERGGSEKAVSKPGPVAASPGLAKWQQPATT